MGLLKPVKTHLPIRTSLIWLSGSSPTEILKINFLLPLPISPKVKSSTPVEPCSGAPPCCASFPLHLDRCPLCQTFSLPSAQQLGLSAEPGLLHEGVGLLIQAMGTGCDGESLFPGQCCPPPSSGSGGAIVTVVTLKLQDHFPAYSSLPSPAPEDTLNTHKVILSPLTYCPGTFAQTFHKGFRQRGSQQRKFQLKAA